MPKYPQIRIVVVDDERTCLDILKQYIQESDFFLPENCIYFQDPNKAVEYLESNKADILIADYLMPEIKGDELIDKAKRLYPRIKTVLFTASRIGFFPDGNADYDNVADLWMEKVSDKEKGRLVKRLGFLCERI